ncbi:hypothetical protein [Cupriavidus alkaliphilus]|uniref:hypothetical protein n=1 Tax=Cupriavidus alkaliphilus TaxID=942866 RepID=UPI00161C74EB|nr:hypothetical protein [Cupriavidus alkaliphilus]MBB3011845.1 hypothetical protein [Cupriavidus alkaliphilus]
MIDFFLVRTDPVFRVRRPSRDQDRQFDDAVRRLAEVKRHFETVCNSTGVQCRPREVLGQRAKESDAEMKKASARLAF